MQATDMQVKYFFSLVTECKLDPVTYKSKAVEKYGLSDFDQITSEQISELNSKLIKYASEHNISISLPTSDNPVELPAPQSEWGVVVPEMQKPVEKFNAKDFRQAEDMFTNMCAHDWSQIGGEHNHFHVKKCLKCPTVQIETYKNEPYQMMISYRPTETKENTNE